ncbi:MAG: HAMP domain-containing sensor histidine kinase [Marinoscillum sp.]
MLSWIKQLLQAGSLPNQPYGFENRRILILNKISLVAAAITTAIIVTHLLIGNTLQPLVVSAGFLVCIPTIYYQTIRRYQLARYWFLVGFYLLLTGVFFYSVYLHLDTSTEYLLIILIPFILIFLDGKTSTLLTILIIINGSFFLTYRYAQSEIFLFKEIFGLQVNWITISLTVYFSMNFFKKSLVKANELIARDKEELAVADQTKNFLFAVISHDIRSPLNSFKQYFRLDEEFRKDPELFISYQQDLSKKVDDISQTLDDLLFWSKTQLQGITANPSIFRPIEVIEKITVLTADLIQNKNITLLTDAQTSEEVLCDRDHLTIIIRNLVQNAIKFTPQNGTITISSVAQEDGIHISIEDTGKGMDEEILKNLQAGMIVKSQMGTVGEIGTGLGLSLVKELLAKNLGQLHVENRAGTGTKISAILPQAR